AFSRTQKGRLPGSSRPFSGTRRRLVDAFAANVPVPVGAQAAVAAIEGALGVLVFHQVVTQPGGRRAPVATGITHGLEMPDTAQLAPEHGYVGVVVDRQGVECR